MAGPFQHQLLGGLPECFGTMLIRRVWPQRRADHRPACCQRPPRPPDMERGNVPMPDALLAPGVDGYPLYRQVNFDKTLGIGSHCFTVAFNKVVRLFSGNTTAATRASSLVKESHRIVRRFARRGIHSW